MSVTSSAIWAIQTDPEDDRSLFVMPVGRMQLGVLLFNQRESASEFVSEWSDMPDETIVRRVEIRAILDELNAQRKRGCTHVIVDPIFRSEERGTAVTIDEFIVSMLTNEERCELILAQLASDGHLTQQERCRLPPELVALVEQALTKRLR